MVKLPATVADPMVLPLILKLPVAALMPQCKREVLVVVILRLAMVLLVIVESVPLGVLMFIPLKIFAPEVSVNAVPPHCGAEPPMKLFVMVNAPVLDEVDTCMPPKVEVAARAAVWKKLLPVMTHPLFPEEILMPQELDARKKLEILQLEMVILSLFWAANVVVPEAKMPLAGVVAPSRISQLSIVLLSLPLAPVVVLKSTTPFVVEVFTPCTVQKRTMLFEPSLIKRMAVPVVLVLAITNP